MKDSNDNNNNNTSITSADLEYYSTINSTRTPDDGDESSVCEAECSDAETSNYLDFQEYCEDELGMEKSTSEVKPYDRGFEDICKNLLNLCKESAQLKETFSPKEFAFLISVNPKRRLSIKQMDWLRNLAAKAQAYANRIESVEDVKIKAPTNPVVKVKPAFSIDAIKTQQKSDMKKVKFKTLSEFEVQTLFGLEEPLKLGFPLSVRVDRHTLSPDIKDYYFDPELLKRFIFDRMSAKPIMFVGEKGTGKTSFLEQFHARMGMPLLQINGGDGVDEDYLFGGKGFDGDAVVNQDGLLSYAIRHGLPMVLNEISAIRAKVLFSMHDVLETGDVIVLKHHGLDPKMKPEDMLSEGGNIIVRHPWFKLYATDNTGGKVSKDHRYTGSNTLNAATRERFLDLTVSAAPREAEKSVLLSVVENHWRIKISDPVTRDQLKRNAENMINGVLDYADLVRRGFQYEESVSDTITLRGMVAWTETFISHSTGDNFSAISSSFEDAVYTKLEEDDQVFAKMSFTDCFLKEPELKLNSI